MKKSVGLDRRAFLSLSAGAGTALLAHGRAAWAAALPQDELTSMTLEEASIRVRTKQVSPLELTRACLARIEKYDGKVNAFITVTAELALAQAQAAEKEIHAGRWRGPLHGIPVALKDVFDTAGIPTTGASFFVNRVPTQDGEVVTRLQQVGAVLLGKLNGTTESHWGPVHNPWALDHECGYTSGGSGAAVAADFCFGALGTDGGGSVRMPAAACGVVGLMPTYGLVSNRGALPGKDSLTHVGPMTRTVLDTALLLQGIAGHDSKWVNSARVAVPDYAAAVRVRGRALRLGIPKAGFFDGLEGEVAPLIDAALATMARLGTVRTDYIAPAAYFADIVRYFDISDDLIAESLAFHAPLLRRDPKQYQPLARKNLSDALRGCVDGIRYVNARNALLTARAHVTDIFADHIDLLVMPTWKRLPMTHAAFAKSWRPNREHFIRDLCNTLPFNVLGLPSISVPCGFSSKGLPVGIQLIGRPFAETEVLAFAHAYEQQAQWHLRKPPPLDA